MVVSTTASPSRYARTRLCAGLDPDPAPLLAHRRSSSADPPVPTRRRRPVFPPAPRQEPARPRQEGIKASRERRAVSLNQQRWKSQGRDPEAALGLVIGGLGPLARGRVCSSRSATTSTHTNVALVFVVARGGGRRARRPVGRRHRAAICLDAVVRLLLHPPVPVAAASTRRDDIETTLLLLAVGLIVGEIVVRAQPGAGRPDRGRDEIARSTGSRSRSRPVAACRGAGSPSSGSSSALLSLRDCGFERAPYDLALPRLERSGAHRDDGAPVRRRRRSRCPAEGVAIPVLGAAQESGRLVLTPDPSVGVSLEERVVAIALADQLGAAIARRPVTTTPTTERHA